MEDLILIGMMVGGSVGFVVGLVMLRRLDASVVRSNTRKLPLGAQFRSLRF